MRQGTWISLASLIAGLVLCFAVVPAMAPRVSPFPDAAEVVAAFTSNDGRRIALALVVTLARFAAATTLGAVLGATLGSLVAVSRPLHCVLSPWLDISRVTPAVVWVPVLLAIHGIPTTSIPFILGTAYATFYISLHVGGRLADISLDERTYMAAARVSWVWRFKYCHLPRLISGIATGLKIGGSVALILVVVGEALLRVQGAGELIVGFMESYARGPLWATICLLSISALVVFHGCSALDRAINSDA